MAIFRTDEALANWVNNNRNGVDNLKSCTLHLFKSTLTPNAGTVLADYAAAEADFGGSAAQTITDWGAAVVTAHVAKTTAGTYTFTATGTSLPNTINGVYVLDSAGKVLYSELIPTGAVTIGSAGQSISYVPSWSDEDI